MSVDEFRLAVMHIAHQGFSAHANELGVTTDQLFRGLVAGMIGLCPFAVDNLGAICFGCNETIASELARKRDDTLRRFVREVGEDAVCRALGMEPAELQRQMGR